MTLFLSSSCCGQCPDSRRRGAKRHHLRFLGLSLLLGLGTSAGARAQDISELIGLAGREQHTRVEQRRVEAWIKQQLTRLDGGGDPTQFRMTFDQLAGPEAAFPVTARFRGLLGEKCGELFPPVIARSDTRQALAMAQVLARIPTSSTVKGLADCLTQKSQAVRYWGAQGFRLRRPELAAAPPAARAALAAIQTAAAKEANGIILRQMYAALDYTTPNAPAPTALAQEVINTITAVMDARFNTYRARSTRGANADADAAVLLAKFWHYRRTPDAAKPKLVEYLGNLFQVSALLYVDADAAVAQRNDLPMVVLECETQLTAIWRAANPNGNQETLPQVHALLKTGPQAPLLKLEIYKWIGTPDVRGLLNQPPLNAAILDEFKFDDAPSNPR